VAAVHKAGEERRLGATPATATLLPSSWKARDSAGPSEARSRLEMGRHGKIKADGGLTWFFVAMVITKRTRPETTRHLFAG